MVVFANIQRRWRETGELGDETRVGVVYTVRHGKVLRFQIFLDRQQALEAAGLLFERALAIHEARLGEDHPTTAQSLNNLASVLANQGDLADARPLFERALAIREARLGQRPPRYPTKPTGSCGG